MNEFLEQFLLESRELVERASADLLALEDTTYDPERLDSAFRAFHTLKGGAGFVDFDVMVRAVHVAEDALSGAKSGTRTITAPLIRDCLSCLDQVSRWLEEIERSGKLPKGGEADAKAIIARFERSAATDEVGGQAQSVVGTDDWVERMLVANATLRGRVSTAVRYTPDPGCFFQGMDPVATIAALPGLLCVDLQTLLPWPTLDELDPFASNLVLSALTESPRVEVVAALGASIGQCEVHVLAGSATAKDGDRLSTEGREVLEAQVALTREPGTQGARGRIASAGVVAANVLRSAGRAADAGAIARSMEESLAANDPRILREAIEAVLGEPSSESVPLVAPAPPSPAIDPQSLARTLRIDAARIDALVNLSGELTVAKNAIGHAVTLAQAGDPALPAVLKQRHAVLDRLIAELQRSVLGLRVLPVRHVFQRFPRLVRELSASLGKHVALTIEGGETEADKVIVEMLFEPLLHVLRNALDHGIEDVSTRAAQRKPQVAKIILRASREGEHVVVEVSDDGQGIDLARVRQVAVERNLISAEVLAGMDDEQLTGVIFAPGFSTSSEVTGLSGRGVGLDAARAAVETLAGRVDIESRAGEGTTVRFTLPFSVMMTPIMSVRVGGQAFGIPLEAVVETIRIGVDRIAPVGAGQAIVLRNRTVPLVDLAEALGLHGDLREEAEATVVVAKVNEHHGALRVDRIGERMEVMLKPLDGVLAGLRGLAGSTILGDGSVLLVLDLRELFQ